MKVKARLEESARKAGLEASRAFARRFETELKKRIPVKTGALKKSVVFGLNGNLEAESMSEAVASLKLGDTLSAASTADYWATLDIGLHVGGDGRPKGSKDAPNGISAEALAASARKSER